MRRRDRRCCWVETATTGAAAKLPAANWSGSAQSLQLGFEERDAPVLLLQRGQYMVGLETGGMCCGQFASQAWTVNTRTCSGLAL